MANKENSPSHDYIDKWSDDGMDQLYAFLNDSKPTLGSTDKNDPFILAQEFQTTISKEKDPKFQDIMGQEGKNTLNKIMPTIMIYRRLAISTTRLFALNENEKWANVVEEPVLVAGMFDEFAFGISDEQQKLSVELIYPKFLRPRPYYESELLQSATRFIIPVDAIGSRAYDPETFFPRAIN